MCYSCDVRLKSVHYVCKNKTGKRLDDMTGELKSGETSYTATHPWGNIGFIRNAQAEQTDGKNKQHKKKKDFAAFSEGEVNTQMP